MLIMLFASGMPTAEGTNQSRYLRDPVVKAKYLAYRDTTSPLIPMPPQLYGALSAPADGLYDYEGKATPADFVAPSAPPGVS
jgi:hypothetical protein